MSDDQVKPIDELSKKTLGSYVKKAAQDAGNTAHEMGYVKAGSEENARFTNKHGPNGSFKMRDQLDKNIGADPETSNRRYAKYGKRLKGIARATDKLTQEELEMNEDQIDEAGVENLRPNSAQTDNDPKTKVEMLARITGMAAQADTAFVKRWFDVINGEWSKATNNGPGDAESNKNSIDMKAGGNRIAPMPVVKIKEELDNLFEGTELVEEAKERISTLFEAAINLRVNTEVVRLEEAYEAALQEEVETFIAEERETIGKYAEYVAERWIEENEVAITDALRLEIAEDFMGRVKEAFLESNVSIPEAQVDALREVTDRLTDLESMLEDVTAENIELRASLTEKSLEQAFDEVSEGLTLVDKEKLRGLVEDLEVSDADEFVRKVKIVREKHFAVNEDKVEKKSIDSLNEVSPSAPKAEEVADPSVAALASRMTTTW